MNCREAQDRIYAERDRATEDSLGAELNGHLAQCDACRRVRHDLTAALLVWTESAQKVRVPDAEREWHAVRRKIRGGASAGTETRVRRRNFIPWLAVPIGAAAALAIAFYTPTPNPQAPQTPTKRESKIVARADSVEVPGNASTMVFVDEKSGWLFVMASEPRKQG